MNDWLRQVPDAVFVYPDRPAVQVVASMLTHRGVSGWYQKLSSGELTVPYANRFFGLDSADQLRTEPVHRLCWYRVSAHKEAALEARRRHGDRVRFVDYESLVRDRVAVLSVVFSPEELRHSGRIRLRSRAQSLL